MPRAPKDTSVPQVSTEAKAALTQFLCEHIEDGLAARHEYVSDGGLYDEWHALYEQASRPRPNAYPGAADLTSYLGTEKVDALKARFTKILFGPDPICHVEGWGESPQRCAKVEAFHQWKAEDTRLQSWASKAIHVSLIEQNGIFEVSEAYRRRKRRDVVMAKALRDPYSGALLGPDGQLQPETDDAGRLVLWGGDESEPRLEVQRESVDYMSQGPQYRLVGGKDFLNLPVHARSWDEAWGYAKRIWLRASDLEARVGDGVYDREAVDKLGTSGERDTRAEHLRQGTVVQSRDDQTAEKELWEVQCLYDIDGDGVDEWLICCVSLRHQTLLRVAFDWVAAPRFVQFVPYPRPDSVYGYSFIGHKLWTILEAHTSQRNMVADRSALATNRPMTKLSTSDYDPDVEPWKPNALITVKAHNELQQLEVADVPASAQWLIQESLGAAERVTGIGDQAVSGVRPPSGQTATGASIVAQASFVRVEDAIMHLRESLEDLYTLTHQFWKRSLGKNETLGRAPARYAERLMSLDDRGLALPKDGPFAVTAADLEGAFRFKPTGSVETADKAAQRQEFAIFISQALPALLQLSPGLAMQFQQNPKLAETLLGHVLRLYGLNDLQSLLTQTGGPQNPAGPMSPMLGALAGFMGGQGGQGGQPSGPMAAPPMAAAPESVQ